MAARTKQIQDSIEYRLCQILFQQGWVVPLENVALIATAAPNVYTIESQFPWVYFDNAGQNTSDTNVRVYRDGTILANSEYLVDYRERKITILSPVSGDLTADVLTFACNIRRGYPTDQELELVDLPVIAFECDDQSTKPFAIGTSQRHRVHPLTVDILASNDPQRIDLSDDLVDYLIRTPLIDTDASPTLKNNGQRNDQFDFSDALVCWVVVDGLRANRVAPRQNGSEKEQFRSLIRADLRIVR
jgi:hypothetical protein